MKRFSRIGAMAVIVFLASGGFAAEGPNRPQPQPVALEAKTTAILVLDLNKRCDDPKQRCSQLMPGVGGFLEKARASSIPIFYSVSDSAKGKPLGEIATALKHRQEETVIYPAAFDKFHGGELQELLQKKGAKSVVIVGSSTNIAVLHTAATAARIYGYNVIIPMDGMNAASQYDQEYTFHHFTSMRGGAEKLFRFTNLTMIDFQ
jgi:nicotinamidase-related amidase